MTLLVAMAAITILFGLWLGLKNLTGAKICAICLAVSAAWLGLLAAYKFGGFKDGLILAMLMGQSVAGIYYLLERRAPREWLVFRLPALLTLTYVFYAALTWQMHAPAGLLLLGIWLIFGTIFSLKKIPKIKQAAKRLIECCGSW